MFWGGIVKEGQPLKSTKIFETMEFPCLNLSQAILVKGESARLSIKMKGKDEIFLAIMSGGVNNAKAINCYVNMTQTYSLQVVGKGAEVHLCGHFENESNEQEDDMMYGDEQDQDEEGSDSEDDEQVPAAVVKALKNNLS